MMPPAVVVAAIVIASGYAAPGGIVCGEGEAMPLTTAVRAEHERLFASCQVRTERQKEVDAVIARMQRGRGRYDQVSAATGVPWYLIGVIHNMECSGRWDCHLHNGDPLTARTVQVPAKRPASGTPPFSWEESAVDALLYQGFDVWTDWSVGGMLYKLEAYNGFGYRKRNVPSPYLWGGSKHYTSGKYVKDGVFSATAVSKQIGVAVVLRRMLEQQLVTFPDAPAGAR